MPDNEFPFSDPFATPDSEPDPPAADDDADDDDDAPKPASLSMTKAELLERVQNLEEQLKKAELIERIHELEGDEAAEPELAPAAPLSHETRSATIDGHTLTWTDATAHQVPEEYVLVERRSRAAGD